MTDEKDELVAKKTMMEIKKALKEGDELRAKKLTNDLLEYFGWYDE